MTPTLSKKSEDAVLIQSYLSGNEHGLEFLIGKHQFRIYNFIFSKILNRDTAEDIFQETFFKIIRTLKNGQYNEEGKFLPWAMRIAHNLIIDHFRKSSRIPKFESQEDFDIFQFITDGVPNAENALVHEQINHDLHNLVDKLPEDQKEVLIMRLYRDMSFKEIAENTQVSINTALGRMRYAIINLRKLVASHHVVLSV